MNYILIYENQTDKHLVIWQPSTNQMWEFWALDKTVNTSGTFWVAQWGGYISDVTKSPGFFQAPYPSWGATATSLMLAGGLMVNSKCTHTYTCTHMYTCTHTYTYTHIDTHT